MEKTELIYNSLTSIQASGLSGQSLSIMRLGLCKLGPKEQASTGLSFSVRTHRGPKLIQALILFRVTLTLISRVALSFSPVLDPLRGLSEKLVALKAPLSA